MGTNNAIEYLQRYQILIFIYYKFYFIIFIIIQFTVYVKNTVLKWRGRVRARKHFKLKVMRTFITRTNFRGHFSAKFWTVSSCYAFVLKSFVPFRFTVLSILQCFGRVPFR